MTCSSSRTWAYMSVNIPCSPGNSKGGAGWRSCHSWFCAVLQIRHAIGSPSVRSSSFISSIGRLDLLVKSPSFSESGYQPGPLVYHSSNDRSLGRNTSIVQYCSFSDFTNVLQVGQIQLLLCVDSSLTHPQTLVLFLQLISCALEALTSWKRLVVGQLLFLFLNYAARVITTVAVIGLC